MHQRYFIVGITAIAAMWMYIDRVCFSTLADPIQKDLGITPDQKDWILSAFFWTYASFQVPMGTLADVFGPRIVLTVSIAAWSLVTAATGFVDGFATLLLVRFLLGMSESSAYPAAAGLVKSWARPQERGRFSSIVALGGRVGGASSPFLTAWLAVALVGVTIVAVGHNPSGVNWRGVFVLYGLCGLIVAAVFWFYVRNRPPEAPDTVGPETAPRKTFFQGIVEIFRSLLRMATSRNMWYFGCAQFCVNIPWAFVITLFPTYLNEVFHSTLEERGEIQSVVLITGCCGMVVGGIVTDMLRRKLGPRHGRSLPIGIGLCGCSLAFFLLPSLPSVWAVAFALGAMAFLVDMHNPCIWSFAQDVGGKRVGAALGWGNMLGNYGAAVSPLLLGRIARSEGWNAAFITSGVIFAVAAFCGFMLNATKPVEPDPQPHA